MPQNEYLSMLSIKQNASVKDTWRNLMRKQSNLIMNEVDSKT